MTWFATPNPRKCIEYGQENGSGDLLFVVRVRGLPARPHPPKQEADYLCVLWTSAMRDDYGPRVSVEVEPPDAA